ncbi:hypothetical protein PR048_003347 [Dryococelus australis]|uniref:Uncharacterized protein n=1 Tax=Dryococelus australis TaxID=614101 RepID=A0ABQ9IMU3_9NEOP|nr:hypothetical protein PR048_003347 [Dryococelus australis]
MVKLETEIMITLWDQILQRFQMTSASLQSSGQDLNTACTLYESLQGYILALCSTFSDTEQKGKTLNWIEHKRNRAYDHFSDSSCIDPIVKSQTPSQQFKAQTFFVIIDNLLSALSKHHKAYQKMNGLFGFLHRLQLTLVEVLKKSSNLIKFYPADLEESLGEELLHFIELLKTVLLISNDSKSKQELVERLITENSLECCFPNVKTALRIYLSLMVTNCTGECLFSKL